MRLCCSSDSWYPLLLGELAQGDDYALPPYADNILTGIAAVLILFLIIRAFHITRIIAPTPNLVRCS